MRSHQRIDERSLEIARAIVARIDSDPSRSGLEKARGVCARWSRMHDLPVLAEWRAILERDWPEVRAILLDQSEQGARLRQSSPFCGILRPRERWAIYRRFRDRDAGAA